jgi:hypothetical protein
MSSPLAAAASRPSRPRSTRDLLLEASLHFLPRMSADPPLLYAPLPVPCFHPPPSSLAFLPCCVCTVSSGLCLCLSCVYVYIIVGRSQSEAPAARASSPSPFLLPLPPARSLVVPAAPATLAFMRASPPMPTGRFQKLGMGAKPSTDPYAAPIYEDEGEATSPAPAKLAAGPRTAAAAAKPAAHKRRGKVRPPASPPLFPPRTFSPY